MRAFIYLPIYLIEFYEENNLQIIHVPYTVSIQTIVTCFWIGTKKYYLNYKMTT